MRVVIK